MRDDAVRPDPGAAGRAPTLLPAHRLRLPHRRARGVGAGTRGVGAGTRPDSRLVGTEAKVETREHEDGQQFSSSPLPLGLEKIFLEEPRRRSEVDKDL